MEAPLEADLELIALWPDHKPGILNPVLNGLRTIHLDESGNLKRVPPCLNFGFPVFWWVWKFISQHRAGGLNWRKDYLQSFAAAVYSRGPRQPEYALSSMPKLLLSLASVADSETWIGALQFHV